LASTNGDKNQTRSPKADNDKGSISAQTVTINSDKEHPIWGTTVKDGWDKALVIGTVALVLVGAFGIKYAIRTLKAIKRQADLMERQLYVAHRAYLILGKPFDSLGGGTEAQFPIENIGQVAGRITSIDIEIIIQQTSDGREIYRRDIKKNADELIVHGETNAFNLLVGLPRTITKDETVIIGGTVEYDPGLKKPIDSPKVDTLKFTRVFEDDVWKKAWGRFDIDFAEQSGQPD